jgi:hypothetical protein
MATEVASMEDSQNQDRVDFLWNVHSYLNEYVRFADAKAGLVVAWTSTLVGVLVAAKFQDGFGRSLLGVVGLVRFVCLLGGFASAFLAVAPRLGTTQPTGFVFWKSILAHKTREQFLARLTEQSPKNLEQHVAGHLYDLAETCKSKFAWVNRSIVLAFVGSILSGLVYMVR